MDCNSSKCEYSIFHQRGCRDPGCVKVRPFQPLVCFPDLSLLDSFTAPKYKKSLTPSTTTVMHVVLPPPVHLHVNAIHTLSPLPSSTCRSTHGATSAAAP